MSETNNPDGACPVCCSFMIDAGMVRAGKVCLQCEEMRVLVNTPWPGCNELRYDDPVWCVERAARIPCVRCGEPPGRQAEGAGTPFSHYCRGGGGPRTAEDWLRRHDPYHPDYSPREDETPEWHRDQVLKWARRAVGIQVAAGSLGCAKQAMMSVFSELASIRDSLAMMDSAMRAAAVRAEVFGMLGVRRAEDESADGKERPSTITPADVEECLERGRRGVEDMRPALDAVFRTAPPDIRLRSSSRNVPATLRHDAGAIARCNKCGRYSMDPATLGPAEKQPACDCGERHYWTGSFRVPGEDARWARGNR